MNVVLSKKIKGICNDIITNGLQPLLKIENDQAFFYDPILNLNRNRVNAEIYKTLVRLERVGVKNDLSAIKEKILNRLLASQNTDGSWNEIHSNYNQPSALMTSFIGEAFLINPHYNDFERPLQHAKDYVIANEYSPGYFKKSAHNYTDCLNVNATCGSFLAEYGKNFGDNQCLQSAKRAAHHICYYQYPNGAFPYTTEIRGYPYKYHLNIPCIHYQGVTLFFLSKIYDILEEDWICHSIQKGNEWLAAVQKKDGYFDWSESGLMYAYCLSGAYAFSTASFIHHSRWNDKFLDNAELSLDILSRNIPGLVNRWESASLFTLPFGIIDAMKSAWLGDYPLGHKIFRLGYALYKQNARRHYSPKLEDKLFSRLSKTLNIEYTWIEPNKNYPDLFMTSEVLDCLSRALVLLEKDNAL